MIKLELGSSWLGTYILCKIFVSKIALMLPPHSPVLLALHSKAQTGRLGGWVFRILSFGPEFLLPRFHMPQSERQHYYAYNSGSPELFINFRLH